MGCDNDNTTTANKCTATATLSDDDFQLNSTDYEVAKFTSDGSTLTLSLTANIPDALKAYSLRIELITFPLSDATISGTTATWSSEDVPTWTAGTAVIVKTWQTVPAPTITRIATDDGALIVHAKTNGGRLSGIRYRVRSPQGTWQHYTGFSVTDALLGQRTMTNLVNGTTYEIQVYSVNNHGSASSFSAWSESVEGTPAAIAGAEVPGGDGTIIWDWNDPQPGPPPPTGYDIHYRNTSASLLSTTLTPKDLGNGVLGCDNANATTANQCTATATLSEDEFTLDGTVRRILKLSVASNGELRFEFLGTAIPPGFKALRVDGTAFAFSSATKTSTGMSVEATWSNTGLSWAAGESIAVEVIGAGPWRDAGHQGTETRMEITGVHTLAFYEVRLRACNAYGCSIWVERSRMPLPAGTIWAAELTVQDLGQSRLGCDNDNTTPANQCTATATLTDDDFDLDSTTYSVEEVFTESGSLNFGLGATIPDALQGYTLQVGDAQFPLADATITAPSSMGKAVWSDTGLTWIEGQMVQLQLKLGNIPTGLTLTPGDGKLDVSWTAPSNPEFTVTGYEVAYKESSASSWTDAGHTGTGTTQEITGLTNYVKYDVRARAQDSDPQTEEHWTAPASAWVTPDGQSVVWESTLTVGSVEFGLGCGAPDTPTTDPADCSSAMSDTGVSLLGGGVNVEYVNLRNRSSGPGELRFAVDRWFANYNYLTLMVDGKPFRFTEALTAGCHHCNYYSGVDRTGDTWQSGSTRDLQHAGGFHVFSWNHSGLSWAAGDTPELILVYTREAYMGDSTWGGPARKTVRERPPTGVVEAERQGFGQRDGAYLATRDDLDIYRLNVRISEPAGPDGLWGRLTVDPKSTARQGVDFEFINSYGYPIPEERLSVVAEPRFHYPEGEGTGWVHSVFLRIIDDNHEDSGETIIIKPEVPGFMSHGMIITILNHDDGPPPEGEAQPMSLADAKSAAAERERQQPKRPIPGRSDNANLASLSLPYGGVLRPAFTPDTTEYTVHLSEYETRLIALFVKTRAAHAGATVTVDGRPLQGGRGYLSNPGHEPRSYRVVVTAADAYTTRTYTLTTTTDPVPPPTPPGVTVTPSTLSVSEDGSAAYTVALDSRPAADVTITPTSGDDGAVGVSPASHTFTPSGWNVAQTFTVSGVADEDSNDETVSVTHAVTSTDAKYDGITAASVAVSVSDTTPEPEQQVLESQVEKPGAVVNLQLTVKGKKIIVTWEAPASGGAVDNYIAHLKPAGGGDGKTHRPKAGKTTTTFRNLKPGTTYRVWVRAQNEAGKGERVHARITVPDGVIRGGEGEPPPEPAATPTPEPTAAPTPEPESAEQETGPPVPGQTEPYNIRITPGDGTLTVTWTAAPREGFEDGEIRHALRWSQEPGVWANPAGPNAAGPNDGITVEGGVYTYTITGLRNGVATGVFIRSFTGGNYNEDSPESSEWVRLKGENTTPTAG